jgi:hypothetical protein
MLCIVCYCGGYRHTVFAGRITTGVHMLLLLLLLLQVTVTARCTSWTRVQQLATAEHIIPVAAAAMNTRCANAAVLQATPMRGAIAQTLGSRWPLSM